MCPDLTLAPYLLYLQETLEHEKALLSRWFYEFVAMQNHFVQGLDQNLSLMRTVYNFSDYVAEINDYNWNEVARKVRNLSDRRHDYDGRDDVAKIVNHFNHHLEKFGKKLEGLNEIEPIDKELLNCAFFTVIEVNQKLLEQTTWSGMVNVVENLDALFTLPVDTSE